MGGNVGGAASPKGATVPTCHSGVVPLMDCHTERELDISYFNREFKVLNHEQLGQVHALTLDILRVKGVLFHSEVAREIFAVHGAKADGACVTFPASPVERCLS